MKSVVISLLLLGAVSLNASNCGDTKNWSVTFTSVSCSNDGLISVSSTSQGDLIIGVDLSSNSVATSSGAFRMWNDSNVATQFRFDNMFLPLNTAASGNLGFHPYCVELSSGLKYDKAGTGCVGIELRRKADYK